MQQLNKWIFVANGTIRWYVETSADGNPSAPRHQDRWIESNEEKTVYSYGPMR